MSFTATLHTKGMLSAVDKASYLSLAVKYQILDKDTMNYTKNLT